MNQSGFGFEGVHRHHLVRSCHPWSDEAAGELAHARCADWFVLATSRCPAKALIRRTPRPRSRRRGRACRGVAGIAQGEPPRLQPSLTGLLEYPAIASAPQASSRRSAAQSWRSICRRGRRVAPLRRRMVEIVREVGAHHDQRVRLAPQLIEHLRNVLRRGGADEERDHRERTERRLQERQLDFERVLGSVRHIVRATPGRPAIIARASRRPARGRAASRRRAPWPWRSRGSPRSAPVR